MMETLLTVLLRCRAVLHPSMLPYFTVYHTSTVVYISPNATPTKTKTQAETCICIPLQTVCTPSLVAALTVVLWTGVNDLCCILAARDTNATAASGRGTRGGSPRPSAPRQARAAQRLSSRISANSVSAAASAAAAAAAAAGSLGDPREPVSRRGSAGSSTVRLSSRKR